MAKRRKVAAPSAEDLDQMEKEFRPDIMPRTGPIAPIAQVASEAATAHQPLSPDLRQSQARDRKDAERLRTAEAQGLVMVDLALGAVDEHVMVRDRTILDPSEMEELKRSILHHGLRLPIEVYDKGEAGDGRRYGLISGYRRLKAMREIHADLGFEHHSTIRAVIRDPEEMGGAIVAMVEENEIRAQLTHYERGRIAVVSAQQGSFGSVEEAVNTLFASASKAKRSKIRSFALIYEELGDMLDHAEGLKEKDGLRLANALRSGAEPRLREALDAAPAANAAEEWARIEPVLASAEQDGRPEPGRGGRPRAARRAGGSGDRIKLSNGITIAYRQEGEVHHFTLAGSGLDGEIGRSLLQELARLLEKP